MPHRTNIDLREIARLAMKERDFRTDFPPEVAAEVARASDPDLAAAGLTDLTGLPWCSIDNDDSRDLDQIECVTPGPAGTDRAYVAVANVSHYVPEMSATDTAAVQNTTSIYTGVETFPMLPEAFSTDLSSLNEGQTRLAVVTQMDIADGAVTASDVYPAVVRNHAKLAYSGVSAFLEGSPGSLSSVAEAVLARLTADEPLAQQVLAQDRVAQSLRRRRLAEGALDFQTPEMRPVLHPSGAIELSAHTSNRATQLIEEFMIASNRAVAGFLDARGLPSLQRVVRTPKNWNRIMDLAADLGWRLPPRPDGAALQEFLAAQRKRAPDTFPDLSLAIIKLLGRGEYVVKEPGQSGMGHFGLGAANYLHGSAPNRRYPDLANQRLLLSLFGGGAPAALEDLSALAEWCTQREGDAKKVERQVHKSIAAVALAPRIGEIFTGFITGSSPKGVYARIAEPPVEGMVATGKRRPEVGERVQLRLTGTDPWRGHIDFALLNHR